MALETATGLATEQRAIASLRPYPANYRRHPERQLLILRESLRVHGQQKPIVITPDGTILAGHGLLEAARLEGWTHMACHVYDGPYPEAFLAMDNRSADLAEDDPQALAGLLKALDDQGQLLAGGWYDDDLKELLAKLDLDEKKSRLETWEPPTPLPEGPTRVQPAEVWQLGRHRVMCGDSAKAEDLDALCGYATFALILADPPYNRGALGVRPLAEWVAWCLAWMTACRERVGKDGSLLVFSYPKEAAHLLAAAGEFPFRRWLSWFYANGRLMPDGFKIGTEVLLWFGSGEQPRNAVALRVPYCAGNEAKRLAGKLVFRRNGRETFPQTNDAAPPDWFATPMLTGFQAVQQGRTHVAQKPLDLVAHIVGGWSRDGDTIFDPFLGSGTILIAAEQSGRICYGMEIMPRYCDIILSRWEAFTGLQAERVDG